MNLSRLAKIDLNLLVALHILIEEGSVSRAANKLSITQPAMSKTLGRLRETFDDPPYLSVVSEGYNPRHARWGWPRN